MLAVADGMGGHAAGEVASAVAISAIADLDEDAPGNDLLDVLRERAETANELLRDMVAGDPGLDGMGTTLTAFLFAGSRIGLLHIGDSRAFLLRDGELSQITHDHTLVQTLVDEGRISEEEASTHPQRSLITRALDGREGIEPDLSVREVRAGDRYLLCTDGLTGPVGRLETLQEALELPDPQESCDRLVQLALRGGGPDNVTVIVADVVEGDGRQRRASSPAPPPSRRSPRPTGSRAGPPRAPARPRGATVHAAVPTAAAPVVRAGAAPPPGTAADWSPPWCCSACSRRGRPGGVRLRPLAVLRRRRRRRGRHLPRGQRRGRRRPAVQRRGDHRARPSSASTRWPPTASRAASSRPTSPTPSRSWPGSRSGSRSATTSRSPARHPCRSPRRRRYRPPRPQHRAVARATPSDSGRARERPVRHPVLRPAPPRHRAGAHRDGRRHRRPGLRRGRSRRRRTASRAAPSATALGLGALFLLAHLGRAPPRAARRPADPAERRAAQRPRAW